MVLAVRRRYSGHQFSGSECEDVLLNQQHQDCLGYLFKKKDPWFPDWSYKYASMSASPEVTQI